MPNPVAVNDLSPISGSLQTSRISYAVETADKDYGQDYNGTTWYSDIPQNGSQYTIITDNYTANYYVSRSNAEGAYVEGGLPAVDEYSAPVFWLTAGTSSLDIITIVNGLPDRRGQIPFNSGSQALNWIASSSNYFAVGPPYEQIDADQLQLYLEASQVISYPTTASTWYDISGNTKNGTLVNGPTFDSNGWFTFDGTDDYVQGPIPNQNPSSATLEVWYNTAVDEGFPGENRLLALGVSSGIPGGASAPGISLRLRDDRVAFAARKADNSGYWDIYSGATVIDGRWKHVIGTFDTTALKRYENGVLTEQTTTGQNYLTASDGYSVGGATAFFDGKIAKARFYSKTLTQAEVLQNYYGGPIVTSSLIYAIDAGNLVSYPKSGTTIYPLTGSNTDTLTNGVGFSPIDGGIWTFDGVDDYIDLSTDPWPANAFTNDSVSIWFKFSNYGVILGQNAGVPFSLGGYVPAIYIDTSFYLRTSMFWGGSTGNQSVSPSPLSINTWYNVTLTNGSNTQKTYLNGELIATLSKTQASYAGAYYYTLGAGVWDSWGGSTGNVGYLQGQIANLYYYDKELTASEVLQNYNATK
jgi:hypothetical protein